MHHTLDKDSFEINSFILFQILNNKDIDFHHFGSHINQNNAIFVNIYHLFNLSSFKSILNSFLHLPGNFSKYILRVRYIISHNDFHIYISTLHRCSSILGMSILNCLLL